MEVDDNPKCDKCGESIKAVAISHLRVCRMTNSAVPSFAFVQVQFGGNLLVIP